MKKAWTQIGIGLLPILLGFCCSFLFALPVPFFLTNLLVIALWTWLCFRFSDPVSRLFPQFLRLCLPGAIILVLAIWQELVPGSALPDIVISASQFYFLSGITLAGRLLTPFLRVITAWPYYVIDYFLLSTLCLLSLILKKKVT